MSRSALSTATGSIEDVRRIIAISEQEIEAVKQLLAADQPLLGGAVDWAHAVSLFRNRKKYEYTCAVVLLYGALERFLQDSTAEYIAGLTRGTASYSGLPEKMRAAHFSHVLTHLGRTRDSRYDGLTNAAQIASAFAGCLQGVSPYVFIAESLLHHTANFRPAMVDDYLGRVGIEHGTRRAIASAPFADYIDRSGYIVPQDRPEAVLDLIVDLVSRRNEVAHGDISNTLAPSALIPYCDQVEAYARGLVEVFEESLLAHLVQYHGVDHGSPIAVYNHDIVCIPSNGVPFSAGSILAIKRVDGPWYSAKVTNVQIDRVEVDSAPMGRNVDVALRIDGRCKDTYLVRSGVYDVLQMPSETVQQVDGEEVESPTRGARLDSFGPSDVEIWRQRRDEAQLWLERNGGGSQGSWLMSEFERCCDGLLQAETRLLDGETDD